MVYKHLSFYNSVTAERRIHFEHLLAAYIFENFVLSNTDINYFSVEGNVTEIIASLV